jgi:hypothetical protein
MARFRHNHHVPVHRTCLAWRPHTPLARVFTHSTQAKELFDKATEICKASTAQVCVIGLLSFNVCEQAQLGGHKSEPPGDFMHLIVPVLV